MHYALDDYIMDVAQNAIEAGARRVVLDIVEARGRVGVRVADDGAGMTAEELARATDPFYTDGTKHARRKVGLGLPFLVQAIEATGGTWSIDSEKGKGTTVDFSFPIEHPDVPPLVDAPGLVLSLMAYEGDFELEARRIREVPGAPRIEWRVSRSELSEALGGLDGAESLTLAKAFLESQEAEADSAAAPGADAER